ncbi:MAG: [FeFe] hydrogenase H-cluster radical SAM maturase HydG [Nitrospirae bacterium]|nr:[FeFe] hydrogenase H-cluster radical SAM maturase HydG [Nitrospirota bacterium]
MNQIIPFEAIELILEKAGHTSSKHAEAIIKKGEALNGLSPEEAATLLNCDDEDVLNLLFRSAKKIKEAIYGNRLVLFAPLYLSNSCVNNCLYCGFRAGNHSIEKKVLTEEDIRHETEALIKDGHKRVLIVAAENPKQCNIDYLERAIDVVYGTRPQDPLTPEGRGDCSGIGGRVRGGGAIRRINVNVAPLTLSEFKRLKSSGIGTYQLFQETYNVPTYETVHPTGPKSDYNYRLTALDRAMNAGIDDVGMGVLFGMYDFKFEVLALLYHAMYLEEKFGVGPHTVSVPRIEPASDSPFSLKPPYPVSDKDFMKLIAILRLAIPYTGIILSTREQADLRDNLFHIGVSQISANSRTYPGGYTHDNNQNVSEGQFSTGDRRTTYEVIRDISKNGFSPSFCTACYRVGRTGKEFMDHAKPGHIQKFCLPNSILSFKEYLLDYGGEELLRLGYAVIKDQIISIEDVKIRNATIKKLRDIETGERDLYF